MFLKKVNLPTLAIALLINASSSIDAATGHSALKDAHDISPVARYKLIDLGTTNLDSVQLSRLEPHYSLAPQINNHNQIMYNQADGAYVRDPRLGEYSLNIAGVKVHAHAINNNGEIVVSLLRPGTDVEWMVWSKKTSVNKASANTQTNEKWHITSLNKNVSAFFNSINDQGTVIGFEERDKKIRPLVWSAAKGLQQLGQQSGYDVIGFPRAINENQAIAGDHRESTISSPMLWRPSKDLEILRNYRSLFKNHGWIELADMVIDQHGVIFGNYLIKHASKKSNSDDVGHYFMYRWDPENEDFRNLEIRDMRLASINSGNTMTGSFNGRAAIFHEGQQPIDLNQQLINPEGKWELIEATAINDRGHIVGFGRHDGEMHLFLLEPTL